MLTDRVHWEEDCTVRLRGKMKGFEGSELWSEPPLDRKDGAKSGRADVIREGRCCIRSRHNCIRVRGDEAYLSRLISTPNNDL